MRKYIYKTPNLKVCSYIIKELNKTCLDFEFEGVDENDNHTLEILYNEEWEFIFIINLIKFGNSYYGKGGK